MGRMRYIGSKARLVGQILDSIGEPILSGCLVDICSGTGIISREAANRGWRVQANDYLVSSSTLTFAQLASQEDAPFIHFGGYEMAISALNCTPPFDGFVFREYSPSGQSKDGHNRKYFTTENAARIDGIRQEIRRLHETKSISDSENQLLIADLIEAANRVANIAGTYGCFLREFSPAAVRQLALRPRNLRSSGAPFSVSCLDAFQIQAKPDDIVYLDPPYTKRQYAAYYHLLETISAGDAPVVSGVTGLRPWQSKSSPFCFRRKALSSVVNLCRTVGAKTIFISYSSEGHIDLPSLEAELSKTGTTSTLSLGGIGRYRPNTKARAINSVTEYLVRYQHGSSPSKKVSK